MVGFSKALCLGLAIYALIGCGKTPPAPAPAGAKSPPPAENLNQLVARYWDEHIAPEGVISPQRLADALAIEQRYLAETRAVSREPLDAEGKLTLDLFTAQRAQAIEGFTYAEELLPLRPFDGPPMQLAALAGEAAQHALSAQDADRWLERIDRCTAWIDQAMSNMREGVRRGYTSPRSVVERMGAQLEPLGRDDSGNVFYTPLRSLAGSVGAADRERITRQFTAATTGRLLPAIRRLRTFLATEYLPKAQLNLSQRELPLGPAWYAYRLKRATGSPAPAADLNRLGMAEVDRLKTHPQAAPAPPLAAADLLSAYQQLAATVQPGLALLFAPVEVPPLEVVAVDLPLQPGSDALYRPAAAAAGSAAALQILTSGTSGRLSAAKYLEQGVPGAYYRDAVLAHSALPTFRRFDGNPAYLAGWGMYAASLGEELGIYSDEAARTSWWMLQMRCAAGLAVDTGVHALGWTRDKALDYLETQSMLQEADAQSLIDAIAAAPADAAACEVGAMKFLALKTRALQVLGSRFDSRAYHQMILEGGVLPFDDLDARVKAWMEASR